MPIDNQFTKIIKGVAQLSKDNATDNQEIIIFSTIASEGVGVNLSRRGEDWYLAISGDTETVEKLDCIKEAQLRLIEGFKEMIEGIKRHDAWANGFNVDMTNGYNQALDDILYKLSK